MVEFSRRNMPKNKKPLQGGFTIVELLIVVVVIAILAAVTIMSYNGITARAQQSKISEDLTNLQKAILVARNNTGKTLMGVTGSGYTSGNCLSKTTGTDLSSLPHDSDSCWQRYLTTLNNISVASGINVRSLIDPWGAPYAIDENEGEGSNCGSDQLAVFSHPFVSGVIVRAVSVPVSGYAAGCS